MKKAPNGAFFILNFFELRTPQIKILLEGSSPCDYTGDRPQIICAEGEI